MPNTGIKILTLKGNKMNVGITDENTTNNQMRNTALLLLSTLTIMSGTVVSPALPGMVAYFGGAEHANLLAQLVVTIPAIIIAISAPFIGILTDKIGRRSTLLTSILIYGLAGAGGLILDTIPALLFSRAVLGIAVAGIMVTTTALIGDYFDGHRRITFMGYRSTAVSAGGLLFLLGGGMLAELSWRAPFAIYLLALPLLPLTFLTILEPNTLHIDTKKTNLTHSIFQEHLRHIHLYIIGMVHFIAFYFVFLQIPFLMIEIGEPSSTKLGIVLGTVTAFSAIFSAIFAYARERFSSEAVFGIAFIFIAAGYLSVSAAQTLTVLILSMSLVGVGSGLLLPNITASAISKATPSMRGRVAGMMSASVFTGQFLSPLVTFPLVSRYDGKTTFVILGLLYVAGSIVMTVIAQQRKSKV